MQKKAVPKRQSHAYKRGRLSKFLVVSWEIFPFDVLICLGKTREEVLKEIYKYGYKLDDEEKKHLVMYGNGRTVILKGGQTVLWTHNFPRRGSGVLAHEITHAVYFIIDKVGIKIEDNCDELFAYMVEYITNKISVHLK